MDIEEARRLLPWYANGALEAHERRELEAELGRSPELRRELQECHALRGAVRELHAEAAPFRDSLFDDALRRIDELEASSARPKASVSFLHRARRAVVDDWRAASGFTRFALAAQFALIFVMAGFLLSPAGRPTSQSGGGFVTASGERPAVQDAGARFDVVFAPDLPAAQLADFLDDQGLQIVSGPSAQRGYVVRARRDADAGEVLARLRGATEVVRFAAPAN